MAGCLAHATVVVVVAASGFRTGAGPLLEETQAGIADLGELEVLLGPGSHVASFASVGGISCLEHERLDVSHKNTIVVIVCSTKCKKIFT